MQDAEPARAESSSDAPEATRRSPAHSSPAVEPEALATLWPTFLERLGAQKMSLAAYLAESKPLELVDGTLTIGLPGFALHQEVLSVAETRRLIARLLSELCQATIVVEYATLPEETLQDRPASSSRLPVAESLPPVVKDIVSLFNATVLNPPAAPS